MKNLLRLGYAVAVVVVSLALWAPGPALGDHDDESADVEVQAPLQATACPLIQVLGLSIDTTGAKFREVADCASLVVGLPVEVRLVNDTPPLQALRVEQKNEDEDDD